MNSKVKFGLTISALVFVALLAVVCFVAAGIYGTNTINNISFSFKASDVNGFIEADYSFAGKTTNMTSNGAADGEKFINYNGETKNTTKQLQIQNNDTIVLSEDNNFVIFKYVFSNTNNTESFTLYVDYVDTQKTDSNIAVLWCYSLNQEIDEFPPQPPVVEHTDESEEADTNIYSYDLFQNPISGFEIKPGKTFLYIKTQIVNLNIGAEFSGDFTFKMIG